MAKKKKVSARRRDPLARLVTFLDEDGWRVVVTRGKSATVDEIKAWESLLGVRFPDDYRAFLETYGALSVRTANQMVNEILRNAGGYDGLTDRVENLTILGHAVDANALSLNDGRLAFAKDGQRVTATTFVPVVASPPYWGEVWGFDKSGAFRAYRKGRLEVPDHDSFEEFLTYELENLHARLELLYADGEKKRWKKHLDKTPV